VISERLSEQQGVDCTRNTQENADKFGEHYGCWGCSGCWMAPHWRFMQDHGVMTNEDYPYTAKNEPCAHDDSKTKGKTKTWGIAGKNDVKTMKAKVMQQPGAVALNASSKQFQFYKSGVLKQCCDPSDSSCSEDTLSINHAVTVVGYSDPGEKKVEKCSVKNWWISCTTESESNGNNVDSDGDSNYWKIQNSWGTWWGDNGFIKMEISDG
jgi:KDEL-tailed cysteine endopeptidase